MSARSGIKSAMCLLFGAFFLLTHTESLLAQSSSAQITISGTSTLRGWSCEGPGNIEASPGNSGEGVHGFPDGLAAAVVTVPVFDIVCGEGDEMTDHMREALHADEFSEIVYQLEEYTVTGNGTAQVSGSLTIAGVTNPINMNVALQPEGDALRATGETPIDMTEYGVEPPRVMLGLLQVRDVARVAFDALLYP